MTISTVSTLLLATPFALRLLDLTVQLLPLIQKIGQLIINFRHSEVTAARTCQFEKDLQELLRHVGRVIVAWVYNHSEDPDLGVAPERIHYEGEWYRRRDVSKKRHGLATLFGVIDLWRLRYEPLEAGLACLFPLQIRLGVTAEQATPALAERVGQWAAQYTQQTVLALLRQEHGVSWSVHLLRKVTAAVSAGLAPFRHAAQVQQVLQWLQQAQDSRGPHRPLLVAGRDGIFVPLRSDGDYHEAATATVAVLDRRGRRLGTVYLGYMPEAGQTSLSEQMTALLKDVFLGWQGPLPRLQYVTDGGHHPSEYFARVLRRMVHPRTGQRLEWEWVIDYYHACGYISKLADALFGSGTRAAAAWAHKMRHWLQYKRHGIFRVLHSAAALRHIWELSPEEEDAYAKAYAYLHKRMRFMDYAAYRRRGLAIGSGITEAACKIVFTQRFKQSGMSWSLEGGQVIVDLRVIWLSGVWKRAHQAFVASRPQLETPFKQGTKRPKTGKNAKKAA